MLKYKVDKDPYDAEILFSGKLTRELDQGLTVLVGCNGSGKTTILHTIRSTYSRNPNYKIFQWNGLTDKSIAKQRSLDCSNLEILASLAFSSEGEEISLNIGLLANRIGNFVRNADKNVIILLDGMDSGLSIDNIIEVKDFFNGLLIPDVQKTGRECYVIASANEYELANGENCIDARTGKKISFKDYEEYRDYIIKSRVLKDKRRRHD